MLARHSYRLSAISKGSGKASSFLSVCNVIRAVVLSFSPALAAAYISTSTRDSQHVNQFHHYGSKTPYLVAAHDYHSPQAHSLFDLYRNWENKVPNVAEGLTECSLIHVNAIIRHGTRAPSRKDLRRVSSSLSRLHGFLPRIKQPELRDAITSWKSHFQCDKDLLSNGLQEMQFLGSDFGRLLRSSLAVERNEQPFLVHFRSSSSSRCQKSAEAFKQRLHQELLDTNPNKIELNPTIDIDDGLMRFFDKCQLYIDQVDDNPQSKAEFNRLKSSSLAKDWLQGWHNRLNIPVDTLTFEELLSIWKVTGIELSEFSKSHLQPLLTMTDLKFLEFLDDVEEYWKKLYGFRINYEMSYPLLADAVRMFDSAQSLASRPRAVFNFAHAETILPILASLGLFRDDHHLTVEHAQHDIEERRFQSSRVMPFAANIAFLLYNVSLDWQPESEIRLQVLVNGKSVELAVEKSARHEFDELMERYHMYHIDDIARHLAQSVIRARNNVCSVNDVTMASAWPLALLSVLDSTSLLGSTTAATTVAFLFWLNRRRMARPI